MINLVSNAVKFTAQGKVEVQVHPAEPDGGVRITVTDTGIGIAEPQISAIFEPFHQAEQNILTRKYPGTGMGLAISKSIVEMLGGRLTVVSEAGKGSVFTLWLPVAPLRGSAK
jgi:signal transduction histidine kinase